MLKNNLIENEIYVVMFPNGFIFKHTKDAKNVYWLKGNTYACQSNVWLGHDSSDYRLATQQEKDHLNQCIKAGKYVEYSQPQNKYDYEIY